MRLSTSIDLGAGGGPAAGSYLTTLNWGLYLKGGKLQAFAGGGTGGNGSAVWQGTASAGPSASFDGFHDGASASYIGPTLDGNPTLDLTTNTRFLKISTGTAGARAGTPGQLETEVAACITAGIYTATDGSGFSLINFTSFAGGQAGIIQGPATGGVNLEMDASNSRFDFGEGQNGSYVHKSYSTTGAWVLVQYRWTGGVFSIRLNNGAWTSTGAGQPNMRNVQLAVGATGFATAASCYGASYAYSPTYYDDTAFSNIYSDVKSLYPSAVLP